MDKGQHLRLFITAQATEKVVAMSTELSFHGSAQTENSTTKDTTDAEGAVYDEFDVVGRAADINFSALVAAGTDTGGRTFADMLDNVNDTVFGWKIALASGNNNREMGQIICSGLGKLVNIQATGQVNQQATYSGSINVFGEVKIDPAPVEEWMNADSGMTYQGIATFERQGKLYAVVVGQHNYKGTMIYPIAHNGILMRAIHSNDKLTGLEEIANGNVVYSFDAIKDWAENQGYNMESSPYPHGVYDYPFLDMTELIGQDYLGTLQPINNN